MKRYLNSFEISLFLDSHRHASFITSKPPFLPLILHINIPAYISYPDAKSLLPPRCTKRARSSTNTEIHLPAPKGLDLRSGGHHLNSFFPRYTIFSRASARAYEGARKQPRHTHRRTLVHVPSSTFPLTESSGQLPGPNFYFCPILRS